MSATRLLLVSTGFAVLFLQPPCALRKNTRTWTGGADPVPNWTTASDWNGGVPGSGDTALFNSSGIGNTNIGLTYRRSRSGLLNLIAHAPSYLLGTFPDDKFNVDNGGSIIVTQTVVNPQTINADLHLLNATVSNSSTAPFTLGAQYRPEVR